MGNVNEIFAKAVVETWKERVDSGECTLYEMEKALIKARDSPKN